MDVEANEDRCSRMPYRKAGRTGVRLPAVSLGLWQNFGDSTRWELQRQIVRTAFDRGVTHFDLANNYGPPHGSAEANFGKILVRDFRSHRDEMFISTKAGYGMWAGPYGIGGSRKHMLASLDQSLERLGLDYVDVFYSHCADPNTPLEETMSALHSAVTSGRAVYAGISSYSTKRTVEAEKILSDMGTPLLVNQSSYSMFNRWIETDLLDTLDHLGAGLVAFSPLAQGLLTNKYLAGIPADSRAARGGPLEPASIGEEARAKAQALQTIAEDRGQSLAQMALSWALRDSRVTTVLVGASSVEQLGQSLECVSRLDFEDEEIARIDEHAVDLGINLWLKSSSI
ncbi:aldo/keto reductase [Pseudarthrobacter phenanthrenivorans]|uniref:aldo/keto reductase n=1 Tax=Pseudarthrobacter phenanthrenivorans TaxID=361575 RepID=UPI00344B39AD